MTPETKEEYEQIVAELAKVGDRLKAWREKAWLEYVNGSTASKTSVEGWTLYSNIQIVDMSADTIREVAQDLTVLFK